MIIEITDNEFDPAMATGLNILLFYKDKCPFCNAMKKILVKFSGIPGAKGKDIQYYQMNRENSPKITKFLEVGRIPSLYIFRDGKKIAEKSGDVTYRQLEKMTA